VRHDIVAWLCAQQFLVDAASMEVSGRQCLVALQEPNTLDVLHVLNVLRIGADFFLGAR